MEIFKPISHAFTDTMLQVRAKPLVFLLVWLALSLAPQLLVSYVFQQPVSDMMDTSIQIINDTMTVGEESLVLTSEISASITRGMWALAVMMVVLLLTEIYLGAVLAGVVKQFRDRKLPIFVDSLRAGVGRFPNYAKSVFFAGFKILIKPLVVFVIAVVIGSLLNQPVIIYLFFIVSGILFLSGLLRYGLGPFVHLSLGSGGRDSAAISKTYFYSHRPVVSVLFMFIILLPMVLISFLMNLLISLGLFSGLGGMVLGILQSLLQLTMTVVVINFAMNNFQAQDWGIGESAVIPE